MKVVGDGRNNKPLRHSPAAKLPRPIIRRQSLNENKERTVRGGDAPVQPRSSLERLARSLLPCQHVSAASRGKVNKSESAGDCS